MLRINKPPRSHKEAWLTWLAAVAGHHGAIPTSGQLRDLDGRFADPSVKQSDSGARAEWFKALAALFLDSVSLSLHDTPPTVSQSLLEGFCAVCDWLGSNAASGFFEYDDKHSDIAEYYQSRLSIAEKALASAGLYQSPYRLVALPNSMTSPHAGCRYLYRDCQFSKA